MQYGKAGMARYMVKYAVVKYGIVRYHKVLYGKVIAVMFSMVRYIYIYSKVW